MPDSIRVLIADDDELVRRLVGALVESEVELELVGSAKDADEAIELAAEHAPDVALLDLNMPGGGGHAAALQIKSKCPDTRIVALTAVDTSEAQMAILRAGAVGYVVKGAPSEEILGAIRSAAKW